MNQSRFFAVSPLGTEDLLGAEIEEAGGVELQATPNGILFDATLESAYRLCLWSRVATRVYLPVARFEALDGDQLYAQALEVVWEDHLPAGGTFAVNAHLRRSALNHSHFAALRVKDAIVDRLRERWGQRPDVQPQRPDLQVSLDVDKDQAMLSIDLAGESLHRRGYRRVGGAAPLKENLAAAVLLRAGWADAARRSAPLLDPLCGTGTLLIEGALIAADGAPGLWRDYYGFCGWRGHREDLWQAVQEAARERFAQGLGRLPVIAGCERDPHVVESARENLRACGLEKHVRIDVGDFSTWLPDMGRSMKESAAGLVVTNPPYGERLGDKAQLQVLYSVLGGQCRQSFAGWQLSVFTSNPELASFLGLRASRTHSLRNGPIQARLYHYHLGPAPAADTTPSASGAEAKSDHHDTALMLANRLRKNFKAAQRWAKREGVCCYRVYDADLPEYAAAIDYYDGRLHVQEYKAPSTIDPGKARRRLQDLLRISSEVIEVAPDRVFLKQRKQQKGEAQYGRMGESGHFFEVSEGPCRFLVNLGDYLDSGLFLDHRPIRQRIMEMAAGKRFLNLFAYTGSATVFAARGGAQSSTTVDASRTYLDWAKENFRLNGLDPGRHKLERADVMRWIDAGREKYDLIFLDPPTFSNSKTRGRDFDVQRDHAALIERTMRRLEAGGTLVFSTNFRKFRLDAALSERGDVQDISAQTVPWDFRRSPKIHQCFLLRHPMKD